MPFGIIRGSIKVLASASDKTTTNKEESKRWKRNKETKILLAPTFSHRPITWAWTQTTPTIWGRTRTAKTNLRMARSNLRTMRTYLSNGRERRAHSGRRTLRRGAGKVRWQGVCKGEEMKGTHVFWLSPLSVCNRLLKKKGEGKLETKMKGCGLSLTLSPAEYKCFFFQFVYTYLGRVGLNEFDFYQPTTRAGDIGFVDFKTN